jgi:hypothetical protein
MLGSTFISRSTPAVATWLSKRVDIIKLCLDRDSPEEALVLLYSAMDTISFIGAPQRMKHTSREDFIDWCDEYVVRALGPDNGPNGHDLYGARCGLLHNSSAASSIGNKGEAREINYRFKGRTGVNLMANTPKPFVLVDLENLVDAFCAGSRSFLIGLEKDPQRMALAEQRASQFFTWGVLDGIVQITSATPKSRPTR